MSGIQGTDPHYIKAGACLKHYAAYSEETGRLSFPAVTSAQDMEDTYLPAFSVGVEKGNAVGIMCSYNAETYGSGIYGPGDNDQHGAIPSCANKGILNDLAREKWGFNGYITSDCGAVNGVQNQHHYTPNSLETVTAVLTAGMDTDCGGFMGSKTMLPLLQNSSVASLVDTALKHLFTVQFRLGFGDPRSSNPWFTFGPEVVNTPEHQALAKEAADQSLVLLKNEDKTLPLLSSKVKHVAVIGRNANATGNMQGNYFGTAPYLVSPCAGLAKKASSGVTCLDGSDVKAATAAAAAADAVVLAVGLTSEGAKGSRDEAEGHDRTSLLLPDNQDALISAVASAAKGKPVIIATMGGGPVDLTAAKANSAIGAIMWVGYPGQSGGDAIADAIFGATNPSGKLTMTWYPESFAQAVSIFDMGMRPNKTSGNPGRSHRFYTGTPVFAFGEGLSYTTFHTSSPHIELMAAASATVLAEAQAGVTAARSRAVGKARMTVRNTGNRTGAHSVILYAAPPVSEDEHVTSGAPRQTVVGFEKIMLKPGQEREVAIDITAFHLTWADAHGKRVTATGPWRYWTGAVSDRDQDDTASVVML